MGVLTKIGTFGAVAALAFCGLAGLAAAPASAQTAAGVSLAQTPSGGIIRAIDVRGNQRIEDATVLNYMTVKPGDRFSDATSNESLKALFATGLFADVKIGAENDVMIVLVVENPVVNRVAFEGNQKLDDATLQAESQIRPRTVFTRAKAQADVQRMLEIYRRSGRFGAAIEPKVIQLSENRVDLVYEINEGPITGVERILFIGNKRFSDGRLRDEIATRETRWWRLLTSDDNYDPDRLTFDRELLRRFYLRNGYADFRVVSAVAELSRDRTDFIITFTVDEGEQYNFGPIDVTSSLQALDPEVLAPLIYTVEGDVYNADLVDQSIDKLTFEAGAAGYAFVDVRPRVSRDRETRTIAITYVVNEGPRVYVERIDIEGNVRTLDKVIRREFRLAEGDAFNVAKLERSQRNIRALGFFSKVEVNQEPGSSPDKTVINVEVEEQSTGELSIGAGFSSADSFIGDVSITERNLLGRGQYLRLAFTLARRRQQVDLRFTEPYFLDRNVSAGFDLFHTRTDLQNQSSYDTRTTGGALRAGFALGEYTRFNTRYTFRRDDIRNVDNGASIAIQQAEGHDYTSAIGYTISYDRRDDPIQPTTGYRLAFSQDFAGLGGDTRFVRNEASAKVFRQLFPEVVASVEVEGGAIFGFGKDVRLTDRFYLGGDSLRGFENAGVGPRDLDTDDSLGGNYYAVARTEVSFPLGLPEEYGISGAVFMDVGTLAENDDTDVRDVTTGARIRVDDDPDVRVSAGASLFWNSPFGPLRLNVAKPLVKKGFDEPELFRFTAGTRF